MPDNCCCRMSRAADLIVVLMGGSERILGAVDLYKEGLENCGTNNHPGYEVLETRGVKLPGA